MVIELQSGENSRAQPKAIAEVAKAISAAVPLLMLPDQSAIASAMSAALPSIIEAIISLAPQKLSELDRTAWNIVRAAYAAALARFFASATLGRRPAGAELETLLDTLIRRADIIVNSGPNSLTVDTLTSPLKLPVLRDATKALSHEIRLYCIGQPVADIRRHFEDCLLAGFTDVRNSNPRVFEETERALSGPLADALEKRRALDRHHEFIIRGFTQKPIFGQEESGVTLNDIYVRQRGLWEKRVPVEIESDGKVQQKPEGFFDPASDKNKKWRTEFHVDDLHATLSQWLQTKTPEDCVRVIGGGPGSGKSTFAKAFAMEVIDGGSYDLIFVPLQDIDATGTFQSRIDSLFRNRTELGLDRTESPLNWLGQRDPNGNAPYRPLLIVCDGLDEIAPPGSSEAINVTTDFIQALSTWISNRNSGGLFVRAIVLGRTISAQEAFRKLSIDHRALIKVAGLLPVGNSPEIKSAKNENTLIDPKGLLAVDQRLDFWNNWCRAKERSADPLPEALRAGGEAAAALQELTAEPLLLYLLIWTGYLDEQWEKAADNRNHVYAEIFRQIYCRRWGDTYRPHGNRHAGGHVGTDGLNQEDFFLLQEALGLASWTTGGRTVSNEAFAGMLKVYLNGDKREDLSESIASSLKSVALQGYTRSVEGENAGFEFVHKTIGEYLIGRGLLASLVDALDSLKTRVSDSRCLEAARKISRIYSTGGLRSEIARFFEDEIRLRFDKEKARSFLDNQLLPFTNWALKHGLPINVDAATETEPLTFSKAELLESRALDAIWCALQTLARIAYPWHEFSPDGSIPGWRPGALKINWPSPHGFVSLFNKIGSRVIVSENRRMARFDFLDLRNQAVTDFTYGSVIYSSDDDSDKISPETWCAISLKAANLNGAQFYHSNLSSADLTRASLRKARLNHARLSSSVLEEADLQEASLSSADLTDTNLMKANLSDANLYGSTFYKADLTHANLSNAQFGRDGFPSRSTPPTVFSCATLYGASFEGAVLGRTIFDRCDVADANFSAANMEHVTLLETTIHTAITIGTSLPKDDNRKVIFLDEESRKTSKLSPRPARSATEGIVRIVVLPIKPKPEDPQ